jgi:hypothetical protein
MSGGSSEGLGSEDSSESGIVEGDDEGTTTGGSVECDAFVDDQAGPTVSIDIRNETAETIYLIVPIHSPVSIRNPSGTEVHWTTGPWPLSCEKLMQGVQICGNCACNQSTVQIMAGGQWIANWAGLTLEWVTLPDACWDQGACGPDCLVARAADHGSWTFEVTASSGVSCSEGPCECAEAPTDGSCVIHDPEVLHDESLMTETAILDYPNMTNVELVFD